MTNPTNKANDRRRRQLAAIHIQAQAIGLEDEAYRALLKRVANVDSAADLDPGGRRDVLVELDRLSGRARPAKATYPGRPTNMAKLPALIDKIEAQLASMKLSWAYADAIARQQTGIARVAWCKKEEQLLGVLAALDREQRKRNLSAWIDELLTKLGWDEDRLHQEVKGLKGKWRRNIKLMDALSEHLSNKLMEQA